MATYPTDIHPGAFAPVTTATPAAAPAAKRGFLDFGLTDAERDAQLQRTVAINNQEMARLQAKRAAEQAAVNQPVQGAPMPGYRPAPMMGPSYPYQIPNRDFTWQTTPQEQVRIAGNLGRQDLGGLLATGEYGPLAGQQYRYTPQGTTQINYGPGGGYGSGFGWPPGGFPPVGWPTNGQPTGSFVGDTTSTMVDVPTTTQTTPTVTSTGVPTVTSTDGVIPDDWTPGLVPAGEEWNFRAEDFRGPAKDWTAPLNPYGTSPQGYQTAEQFANMQDFQKALAAQPMGTSALINTPGYTSTGLSTGRTGDDFAGTTAYVPDVSALRALRDRQQAPDASIMKMENQRRAEAQARVKAQGGPPSVVSRQTAPKKGGGIESKKDAAKRQAVEKKRADAKKAKSNVAQAQSAVKKAEAKVKQSASPQNIMAASSAKKKAAKARDTHAVAQVNVVKAISQTAQGKKDKVYTPTMRKVGGRWVGGL